MQNSSQSFFSCLLAFILWFLAPSSFLILAELRINEEINRIPELKRDSLEITAYYLTVGCMGTILLLGPQLMGASMRKCQRMLINSELPLPKRHFLIWFSVPLVLIGVIIDSIGYSLALQNNSSISWETANIFCTLPITLFSLMFVLVQTSMLLVSSSMLTLCIIKLDILRNPNVSLEQVWSICETYEAVISIVSPYYLLYFTISSSCVMMLSFLFYMYFNFGYWIYMISPGLVIIAWTIVIIYVTMLAEECQSVVDMLILNFR